MKKIKSELLKISWDKIFLNLKVKIPCCTHLNGLSFILINRNNIAVTEFDIITSDSDTYDISLNITNSGINRCVDNGVYRLLITDETEVFSLTEFRGKNEYLLDKNRCIRTDLQRHAYTVTFFILEKDDDPVLNIQFQYMKNVGMSYIKPLNGGTKSAKRLKVRINAKQKVKALAREVYHFCNKLFYREGGKKIVFISDVSETLSENFQCLFDRICDRGLDQEYGISFVLINRSIAASILQKLKRNVRKLFLMSTANVLVVDDAVSILNWLILDRRQTVIQIWHSGAGFKCIGYARWGALNAPGAFTGHRQYSYFVSDSEKIAHEWAILAGILEEQVIPTGMPRMDKYLNKEYRSRIVEKIYALYPELINRKVILFAPTYRGTRQNDAYYPYDKLNFEALYSYCKNNNCSVMFKMHPFVTEEVPIREDQTDLFYDVTEYKDINDLFYVTDLLITDYSSNMYEFSLMNKPMLAYAFDEIQYFSAHGLPRPYDENIPGKLCHSFDEVIESLENGDFQFEKHDIYVHKYFDHVDTNNCDRLIDWLILGHLPKAYSDKLQNRIARINDLRGKSYAWLLEEKES